MLRYQASKPRMGLLRNAFAVPVRAALVPDYEMFVPPERQMWLGRIKERVCVHTR